MRRRKSYTANSDVLGVMMHNWGAAADKRRAEHQRRLRDDQHRSEAFRRRQERAEHHESLRIERKERQRLEKTDELLIGYRLPSAVAPWVIEYMNLTRCDLRYVKREVLEPFAKGTRTAAETIALLAVDQDGDGCTAFEQIALLLAWYDLEAFSSPPLIEYLVSTGLTVPDIETKFIKPIAGQGLTRAQIYDMICSSDEGADPDLFVAQIVRDWDLGEEWVEPIVEVSRGTDKTFTEFEASFLPALLAEAKLDTAAEERVLSAKQDEERTASLMTWVARALAAGVAFICAWIIPGYSVVVVPIGVLVLSALLPAGMTGFNFIWPTIAVVLAVVTAYFFEGGMKIFALFGISAAGMMITRLAEPGVQKPTSPRRPPIELARAAAAAMA